MRATFNLVEPQLRSVLNGVWGTAEVIILQCFCTWGTICSAPPSLPQAPAQPGQIQTLEKLWSIPTMVTADKNALLARSKNLRYACLGSLHWKPWGPNVPRALKAVPSQSLHWVQCTCLAKCMTVTVHDPNGPVRPGWQHGRTWSQEAPGPSLHQWRWCAQMSHSLGREGTRPFSALSCTSGSPFMLPSFFFLTFLNFLI